MENGRRHRRAGCFRLVAGIFLISLAAVTAAAEDTVSLEIDPQKVVKGSRCTVRIRTSIPWGEDVTIKRPDLPSGMVWWAYPYARSWRSTGPDAMSVRLVEFLGTIRVDKPGFLMLDSFKIESGDQTLFTDPVEITGLEKDEADLPFPVFTGWRKLPTQIWQGQAVPIVLEARNLSSLVLAESVVPSEAPHGLLEKAPGWGSIVTRSHGDDILYDVPVASWIWTLNEPGRYFFPGVKCTVASLRRSTPGFWVDVLPVPDEVLASGAVGRFVLSAASDNGPYSVGDILSIRIRVEGEGNMNVLRLPVPVVDGASLAGHSTNSSFLPGAMGFRGWREECYDFQLERSGNVSIKIPEWVWFNPYKGGRVLSRNEEVLTFAVEAAAADHAEENKVKFLGAEAFRFQASKFNWRNSFWLLIALPGFVFFLVVFIIKPSGKKFVAVSLLALIFTGSVSVDIKWVNKAGKAASLAENGKWDEAAEIYSGLIDDAGPVPGLLHDMAFVRLNQGQTDKAVYLMRKAMLLRPGTALFQQSLDKLESQLSLDEQVSVPLGIPPAAVFGVFILAINFFFFWLARLLGKRNSRDVMVAISAFLLLALSLAFLLYTENLWKEPTAVVKASSTSLRKIPGPLANNWIQLPAGTAVEVLAKEDNDVLLRTGFGLEGWLPESSLMFLPGDTNGL